MDDQIIKDIEYQIALSQEELLRMLATSGTLGSTPGTSKDGEKILKKIIDKMQGTLCINDKVRAAYEKSSNSKVLLVAAVVDCIAGAVTGVSPVTASILLVNEGLDSICKEVWTND